MRFPRLIVLTKLKHNLKLRTLTYICSYEIILIGRIIEAYPSVLLPATKSVFSAKEDPNFANKLNGNGSEAE